MVMKRLLAKWRQYRYRFVPWLAFNFKERNIRTVIAHDTDAVLAPDKINDFLRTFLNELHKRCLQNTVQASNSVVKSDVLYEVYGFSIQRGPSVIPDAGQGVIVTRGTIPAFSVTSLYCGLVYEPYEPILFQSINNPFIFRCADGILIDGNDKGLSRSVYRSCRGRDGVWPLPSCDDSWLTSEPICALNVGQYVNNNTKSYPANVAYQEINLPHDFPAHLQQYLPNNHYTASCNVPAGIKRSLRVVVLVSLRDIDKGEELLSSYFTIVK